MTRLSTFIACALALPACATSNTDPNAQASTVQGTKLRRPVGNYAHISLHNVVASNPDLDWTSYLDCLYDDMLSNPGMSGLQLGIQWGDVSTSSTGPNDWRYVTAAFDRVAAWNAQPNVPQKAIQLIINPGFESPSWLLSSIPSCDGLFSGTGKAAKNCGTITIQGFAEPSSSNVLPLPWNPVYIAAWNALLADVQANFGANPNLVSISIAGPTAATSEMFLPNDKNTPPQLFPQTTQKGCSLDNLSACCTPGTTANCYLPSTIWETLLERQYGATSTYAHSDQAFVEAWTAAIATYEQLFSHLTLVLTPASGGGLVDFPGGVVPPPNQFSAACANNDDQSCEAIAQIVANLASYPATGQPDNKNGKAVQVSGLVASYATLSTANFDISGLRYIAAQTQGASVTNQIIAGAQFDHAFTNADQVVDGCFGNQPVCGEARPTCNMPAEQVEVDVLATVFNGTSGYSAAVFGAPFPASHPPSPTTTGPFNFLQVYYQDVQYAEAYDCAHPDGVPPNYNNVSCTQGQDTAQGMIDYANSILFSTASTSSLPPDMTPLQCPPRTCVPPTTGPDLCGGMCDSDQVCKQGHCVVLGP